MTVLLDDPSTFEADALDGLVAAHPEHLSRVDGGVVRSTFVPAGRVGLVIGGGSGHYPTFAGFVGPGLAMGSACGNIFSSPAVGQIYRVAHACEHGGGLVFSFGNYAGDVLNFGQAQERLRAEGIDARTVLVTDDIASAPEGEIEKRRGIAGDFTVYKIAGAAAEGGATLDEVERLARKANSATRTLGVAFGGCTVPGATQPLFTVPAGHMSIGMGIHGEPGISEIPIPTSTRLAEILVDRLLAERPLQTRRLAVLVNGLGTVKYEELYGFYLRVARLIAGHGLTIVEPEVGELVTSLDMPGLSVTFFWLDEELEQLWRAPADTPAYRKGAATRPSVAAEPTGMTPAGRSHEDATEASRTLAVTVARLFIRAKDTVERHVDELGRLDAVAGDGDHGRQMLRGLRAAVVSAEETVAARRGVHEQLKSAAEAWSEKAGGTSGALWAIALSAIADALGNRDRYGSDDVILAAGAGLDAILTEGKAQPGDKTMVDAIEPFVRRLETGLREGTPLSLALASAAADAATAAEATSTLRPRIGRARPLAEKSVGHADPGAVSFSLLVAALASETESHPATDRPGNS